MLCPLLIGFGNSLNRRERREDLPKSDAGHLVGFCPADGQLGLQVAGGVGETGFLPSHCLVLFFAFCVLFTPIFSPFKFHIWSNYCLCTLLSWRHRKSVPLSGGAVPSHRTCILVTGLLRKPRCSRRKPAGETCLGYSWL